MARPSKPRRTTPLSLAATALACAVVGSSVSLLGGCSNRAHRDLYQQRLASEARVLEDQLYDADYQNRVLRDRLERYRREVEASRIDVPTSPRTFGGAALPPPVTSPHQPWADDFSDGGIIDMGDGLETEDPFQDDFGMPMFDAGEPVDVEQLDVEKLDVEQLGVEQLDAPEGVEQGVQELPAPLGSSPEKKLLPAPSGPIPPGPEDTKIDPVVPGEVLPPPARDNEIKPGGQILLPDSIQADAGVPERLQLHPTLSVAHHTDGKLDGAVLVINALDKNGRPVDLNEFVIAGEMAIVVLDPTRQPDQARIGKWDFDAAAMADLVRSDPVAGFHVPIQWQGEKPNGQDVIVHVRIRGEDNEMRCEGEMTLADHPVITDWTPRGKSLR